MKGALLRQALLLLEPLGFLWAALIVLTILLWWKKQRWFAAATGALVMLIFLVGSTSLPNWLLAHLERPYAGLRLDALPEADAVVLLGGGAEPSRYEAAGFRLTRGGDRLLMAVELMRRGKARALVVGGAGAALDGRLQLEANLVHQWITRWKLTGAPVIGLERCFHTHDEAVKTRRVMEKQGWRTILLVTSASHLPRATATFRSAGLEVTPVPCNFLTDVSRARAQSKFSVPSTAGLEQISTWLHEIAGWHYYRMKGWITEPAATSDRAAR
jgi:uncharacterized SAM-binding protein YcdF (DUF218 family)